MTHVHQSCVESVGGGRVRSHSCGRSAKYEHEGQWYCKTHHPPTAAAKRAAQNAKWHAEWEAQKQEKAAAARQRAREVAALKVLEALPAALRTWGADCQCGNISLEAIVNIINTLMATHGATESQS